MKEKLRIAICDDHMIERTIIQIYIDEYFRSRQMDVEVREFCSGAEFISGDVTSYDLAVLDIYMDGIDGVETARHASKENDKLCYMFCSASPEFVDRVDGLNVVGYFIKPLVREKFFTAMDRFLAAEV